MKILDFPNAIQAMDYNCGSSVLNSVLIYYGIDAHEKDIMRIAQTNKIYGTSIKGINKTAKHFKLKCEIKAMSIEEIKSYIDKGKPVILQIQAWPKRKVKNWRTHWDSGHFVVAIGYDQGKIYFEDPHTSFRAYLKYGELEERWHDMETREKRRYNNLGILISGKKPSYSSKKTVHMG